MNYWIWIEFAIMVITFLGIGFYAKKRVKNEEDYATARASYSWWVIGLVIPATFASGATFLGSAGMTYTYGWPTFWYLLMYPMGGYLGMTFLGKLGTGINKSGARTIPEFIGLRYNSSAMRVVAALISLLLMFYIAGQVAAGGNIFAALFNMDYEIGCWVATAIVLCYILMGGAHANILTAVIQALVMLVVALICLVFFFVAPGVEGGVAAIGPTMAAMDPEIGPDSIFNSANMQLASGFAAAMIFFAHMPYSLLPHFGMKWASLKDNRTMPKALILSAVVGLIFVLGAPLPALVGRVLLPDLAAPDQVLPTLFSMMLPDWLSAFVIIGIFCAIMSTAAGLFISNAQAVANDVYRCTLAPKMGHDDKKSERIVMLITRIGTAIIAVVGTIMVLDPPAHLTLFLWMGVGGVLSSTAGPVLLGLYWKGATKTAAWICMIGCFAVYICLITVAAWEAMVATGLMFLVSLAAMFVLSKLTKDRMSDEYLEKLGLFKASAPKS